MPSRSIDDARRNSPNKPRILTIEQLVSPVLQGGRDFISRTFVNAISLKVDGIELLFLPFIYGIRDENGTLVGATVILHDLTKLRQQLSTHRQPASLQQVIDLSEGKQLAFSSN
jgi:hypothetical protein